MNKKFINVSKKAKYNNKLDEGYLMKIDEWIDNCKCGAFIDYDGFGHPVKENKMDGSLIVIPSEYELVPKDATHIMWYNR